MTRGVDQSVDRQLSALAAEFAGWRVGRGGSGTWWAVRGNELLRSMDVHELRRSLLECSGRVDIGALQPELAALVALHSGNSDESA